MKFIKKIKNVSGRKVFFVMAFMGQALAFRDDLNTRENFIDTAELRDSVIKLANLVSYTPKRNTAGQGLVKVTAISTTENIRDINGVNLGNQTLRRELSPEA